MKKMLIIFAVLIAAAAIFGFVLAKNSPSVFSETKNASTGGNTVILTAEFTLIYKYDMCGHEISEKGDVNGIIGLTKDEVSKKLDGFYLRDFSSEKVTAVKHIDGYCPKHYILRHNGDMLEIVRRKEKTADYDVLWQKKVIPETTFDAIDSGKVFSSYEEALAYALEKAC